MNHFNTGQNCFCPMERLTSRHQTYSTFYISVIQLNQFVQIFVLPDSNGFFFWFFGVECSQDCSVGATLIYGHHFGVVKGRMALRKKPNAAAASPFGYLAWNIHRAVEYFHWPLIFGFIHLPLPIYCSFVSTKSLIQQRLQADNLKMQRGMVSDNTTR